MSKSKRRLTNAELEILSVLWQHGPSTVRQVHTVLGKQTGYTTVLKLLQIMVAKDLVKRDETHRTHVYQSKASAEQTQKQLVKDLLHRAFGGSVKTLLLHVLAAKRATPAELTEIRKVLDSYEPDRA